MENITGDILRHIAEYFSINELLDFCSVNSTIRNFVYENKYFWNNKLIRDYPLYKKFAKITNPKKLYFKELNKERHFIRHYLATLEFPFEYLMRNGKKTKTYSVEIYHDIYIEYFNKFYSELKFTNRKIDKPTSIGDMTIPYFRDSQYKYIQQIENEKITSHGALYYIFDKLNNMRNVDSSSYKIL